MSSRLGEFANIYELLDESDASGVETGKKAKEAVEQKKAAAAAALAPSVNVKPANPQGQKPTGERRSPRIDRPRQDGDRPRGPRPDGDRPPRGPRPEGERRPRQEGDRPPRGPRPEGDRPRRPRPTDSPSEGGENSFAESGQSAAAGEPRAHLPRDQVRGPRPDRGYERRQPGDQDQRPGKREFDRRSGTGRGKETSKGGAGKGNWGSVEEATALEGSTAATAASAAEGGDVKEGEEAPTTEAAAPAETTAEAAPVDDEPPVRTLATYLKEKKSSAPLQPARQAGEGENNAAYTGYQPFKKEEESLFAVEKTTKERKAKDSKEAKEKKVAADQVLRFQQEKKERDNNREDRGSRGGRGGRGGNQQGGQRRGGNNAAAPNFGDAAAFPGLH